MVWTRQIISSFSKSLIAFLNLKAMYPVYYLPLYGVGELSVFCQSYFNKTLIGQAGSIGGKTRQEVEVMQ